MVSAQSLVSIATFFAVVHVVLLTVAYLIYLERKMSAYIQDRIGPNRVGFDFGLPVLKPLQGMLGLGQPLADGLKFLLKEDYAPLGVDRKLFTLAPMAIIVPALIGFAIIPWGGTVTIPGFELPLIGAVEGGEVVVAGLNVNVGVIYLLGVASLGVYGVTLGGWASNNKYSFLGGLRATAQMVSYEIPLGLSLMSVLLLIGTVMPEEIVRHQASGAWMVFAQPIAAVIFLIAILAEANRAPFDIAEAEQELVGGYHTEYSSMRFALFFLAEYAHMITSSAFFALIFLGGYEPIPFVTVFPEVATGLGAVAVVGLKFMVLFGKAVTLVAFMMLIRWTIPRLRYDQIMMMAWQAVIPIALALVVMTSVLVYLGWTSPLATAAANGALLLVLLAIWPLLPRIETNRRIPMFGSRFNPVPGTAVQTEASDPLAREDRPYEGTVAGA